MHGSKEKALRPYLDALSRAYDALLDAPVMDAPLLSELRLQKKRVLIRAGKMQQEAAIAYIERQLEYIQSGHLIAVLKSACDLLRGPVSSADAVRQRTGMLDDVRAVSTDAGGLGPRGLVNLMQFIRWNPPTLGDALPFSVEEEDTQSGLPTSEEVAALPLSEMKNKWRMGEAHLRRGQHNNAIETFSRLISAAPRIWVPYVSRGAAYLETGRYDLAIRDFNRAQTLTPPHLPPMFIGMQLMMRGHTHALLGDWDKSLSDLSEAVTKLQSTLWWEEYGAVLLCQRGSVYASSGDMVKAEDDFDAALTLNPTLSNVIQTMRDYIATMPKALERDGSLTNLE